MTEQFVSIKDVTILTLVGDLGNSNSLNVIHT